MPELRTLELTDEQKTELEQIRDNHEKGYMRERAAALLKISEGQSAHSVASRGLLKKRDPDTVYEWLDRYEAEGVAGLQIKEGRGRKPAFSP
jgi:transposase